MSALSQPMGNRKWGLRLPRKEMKFSDRQALLPLLSVGAVFIISRLFYGQAGIQFDGDTYLGHWQFVDPQLLRTDLWRSIYYLHTQPPLLNLLTGLVLHISPADPRPIFQLLFWICGLLVAVSIYLLGRALKLPRWLSAIASIWFMVSPGTILYENLYGYTYLLAAALSLAGLLLYQFSSSGMYRWGFLFFSVLAVIALTWALFHILWLLAVCILLLVILPWRRKVILTALLPVLLVTGWYTKNFYLVGQFTASTWAGMNLSKIVTFRFPEKDRKHLVKADQLSKFALLPPFRSPPVYLKLLPDTPRTGIPVWDQVETSRGFRNHHHLVYVKASEYYLQDALTLIHLAPWYYARSIVQASYIYFHSASDYDLIWENRGQIRELDDWWNRLFYGQWQSDETSIARNRRISVRHIGWWIIAGFVTVIVCGARYLWKNRGQLSEPQSVLMAFMLVNILFVSAAGNLLEIGENNRFRFVVDPFLSILCIFFFRMGISKLSARQRTAGRTGC